MAALVLDASAALSTIFPDEREAGETIESQLQNADAVVPPVWPAEVLNGLQVGVRRGRIDAHTVRAAVGFLNRLPIVVAELPLIDYAEQVLPLAERHGLSVYDASYLHLAVSRRLALVTLDRELRAAARAENVGLV